MERLTENKIVLVTRKTRLEDLIARFNTFNQAKFYVEHLGADFSDYVSEHEVYKTSVKNIETILQQFGQLQSIDRVFLTNFIFGPNDIVVALGQDGLVANTLKYLKSQPLIGVNPDSKRWDGVLLPFTVTDVSKIIPELFANKRKIQEVTMAKASLNNGQVLYGVNDIFIGPKSHTSIRYTIKQDEKIEQHSSSGIVVSTGLGSTGWLKSLLTGANCISAGWREAKPTLSLNQSTPWDVDFLYYTVREPFPSKTSTATMIFGKIAETKPLTLVSQMPENGVIFSDGIEADFLEFNSGIEATLSIADKKGHLVI